MMYKFKTKELNDFLGYKVMGFLRCFPTYPDLVGSEAESNGLNWSAFRSKFQEIKNLAKDLNGFIQNPNANFEVELTPEEFNLLNLIKNSEV